MTHAAATPLVRAFRAASLAAVCILATGAARADPFQLVYTGTFNVQEALNPASAASPSFFAGLTPFTITALFDTSTPNLAPPLGGPFAGFRAYAPSLATIDIGSATYRIETILENPLAGVTVAIFDRNSFEPGRYGVGLFAQPVADGAGVVGDFVSASPDFVASALVPTTFTDYYGVGHSSGVCTSGMPPECPKLVTPWVLRDASNTAWNLTFGNYIEDYPVAHTPGVPVGPLNTAQITAVPEPETYALLLAGLVAVAARRSRSS